MAAYATAAELRTQIDKTGTTGTGSDANLLILLNAASDAINKYCNRLDGFDASDTASARVYSSKGRPYLYIDECVEITALAAKDSVTDTTYTAWAADDYIKASGSYEDPDYNSTPYTLLIIDPEGTGGHSHFTDGAAHLRVRPTVQVTAKWGYSATPPDAVKQACLTQAARWFKRGESAWADAAATTELGAIMYRKSLDPDVQMMLTRYRKPALGL
jgi:hypothetical protein